MQDGSQDASESAAVGESTTAKKKRKRNRKKNKNKGEGGAEVAEGNIFDLDAHFDPSTNQLGEGLGKAPNNTGYMSHRPNQSQN